MYTAIVLAAGCSRRMKGDKLLALLDSKTVIEHTLENVLRSDVNETIVVLGHKADKMKSILKNIPGLKIAVNKDFEKGQASSIKCGLKAVNPVSKAVVFCLGDQPFIDSSLINLLIERFKQEGCPVVCPLYHGKRGNPTLFNTDLIPQFYGIEGDIGGRELIEMMGTRVCTVETDCPEILFDIDFPEDLKKARNALKKKQAHDHRLR